jgi:uncharacterized membrane protein YedE/YeeE
MAPYITADTDWYYVIAFTIGIGFGWILEQAGFSSSRKMASVFYAKDFTVLKVFFTAAITASTGLLILNQMEIVDFGSIYIPKTFVVPTIVGGVIMGLGFVWGGYCPGTSFSALAIGKIDALAFLTGITIGIFSFGLAYEPFLQTLKNSTPLGKTFVYDTLGLSAGVFALIFILFGLSSFYITDKIKKMLEK